MLLASTVLRFLAAGVLSIACALILSGCRKTPDAAFVGTYPMGERVQIGSMTYQVLESQWRTELGSGGRAPKDRYLFVKLSITNGDKTSASIPGFSVESNGKSYAEVTENMEQVDDWFGLLRNLGASKTEQGWIVFDAPMAPYKLVLTHGEVGEEKFAHVDIPVHME